MLYAPLCFNNYENHALLDTRVVQSAMSGDELKKIQNANPEPFLKEIPAPESKIETAHGTLVTAKKQVVLKCFIADRVFQETFLMLPTMGTLLIGMSIFEKYAVTLGAKNHLVHLPVMSMHLQKKSNNKFLNSLESYKRHRRQ